MHQVAVLRMEDRVRREATGVLVGELIEVAMTLMLPGDDASRLKRGEFATDGCGGSIDDVGEVVHGHLDITQRQHDPDADGVGEERECGDSGVHVWRLVCSRFMLRFSHSPTLPHTPNGYQSGDDDE